MLSKICKKCKTLKLIEEFRIYNNRGKLLKRSTCKLCQNNRDKDYYKENIEYIKNQKKERRDKEPWMASWENANKRCYNPNNPRYKYYGGKGIRNLLRPEDFKLLWFRDKAYKMKKADIHREDSGGDYTVKNCRYIESSRHSKLHFKNNPLSSRWENKRRK